MYYCCRCKDENLRAASTSGGFFGVLAAYVLEENGVVYGARYDERFSVYHVRACEKKELEYMHGSKYAQSDIRNTFWEACNDLKSGKIVLYTGTPCQIEGLLSFLNNKHTDNLITLDFICRDVPSPVFWQNYLYEISNGREVKNVSFKDKKHGWKDFNFRIEFADGSVYEEPGRDNLFMKCMFIGLSTRPSCSKCIVRGVHHSADYTVGDAWGMEEICSDLVDNKGTSVVITNTSKGDEFLEYLADALYIREVDEQDVIAGNTSLVKQFNRSIFANHFLTESKKNNVIKNLKIYLNSKLLRLVNKLFGG